VLFVEEKCHGKVSNLFLGIFVRRDEIDSFEMTKIDIPPEDIYVEKLGEMSIEKRVNKGGSHLADIFLLVVATEISVWFSCS
jgi:hypothetical protein